MPPFTVVLGRVAIAAAALFVYLRSTGRTIPANGEAWRAFFGMGLLNNLIPFSLIFWGQTAIASGLASILNATTPIFSILVAHFLTSDEKMTPQKIVGVLLGVLGVGVLMSGSAFAGNGPPLWALLACLGAALSYGFAGTFGRRFRRMGIAPAVGAFGQTTASTVMMLPLVALVDAPWHLATPHLVTVGALFALALISTALAYIIFFHILSVGGGHQLVAGDAVDPRFGHPAGQPRAGRTAVTEPFPRYDPDCYGSAVDRRPDLCHASAPPRPCEAYMFDVVYTYLDSPIGPLLLAGDGVRLSKVGFPSGKGRVAPLDHWRRDDDQFVEARAQLSAYFASELRTFDLELMPVGTPFQLAVWQALIAIPYGVTTSYGAIADRIGRPSASRAVGAANGANPIPIIVPCHRVIGGVRSPDRLRRVASTPSVGCWRMRRAARRVIFRAACSRLSSSGFGSLLAFPAPGGQVCTDVHKIAVDFLDDRSE